MFKISEQYFPFDNEDFSSDTSIGDLSVLLLQNEELRRRIKLELQEFEKRSELLKKLLSTKMFLGTAVMSHSGVVTYTETGVEAYPIKSIIGFPGNEKEKEG